MEEKDTVWYGGVDRISKRRNITYNRTVESNVGYEFV